MQLLAEVKERHPQIPVIIMTAYSDLDSAVAAFQGGAFEYLPKPFDVDHALALIRRAATRSRHAPAAVVAPARVAGDPRPGAGDAGSVPRDRPARRNRRRRCSSPANRARARSSSRARCIGTARARPGPFVAINTAAIPKDLLESELFGHERGAFTGAQTMRRGRFEQAEGGTLFLDEIGDMPPDLQVRLLRVLADGEYYRVGGHSPQRATVRIIAATHQNLEERVRQGLFREDLLHRLNVVRLRLPALRERAEDIPPLARHFLQKSARELAVEPKTLTDAALHALVAFAFPGNVRQLENICHWLTVMAPGQRIDVADLPPDVREATPAAASAPSARWEQALDRELAQALKGGERNVGDRLQREFERTLTARGRSCSPAAHRRRGDRRRSVLRARAQPRRPQQRHRARLGHRQRRRRSARASRCRPTST